jgi:hypothetical protein
MRNLFTLVTENGHLKVRCAGILHVCLKMEDLVAIQSWKEDDKDNRYYVEYTLKKGRVLSRYNELRKWKAVLKLLDKAQLWIAVDPD